MKKFLNEFKEFALKGNVMSLAVGVIIGAAFQSVVKSLTDDILSPIIGLFTGQNFDSLEWRIVLPVEDFPGVTLRYGAFLTSVVNFFVMALVIFLLVRMMNRLLSLGKKDETPAPKTKDCPYCQSQINIKAVRCPACTSELESTP